MCVHTRVIKNTSHIHRDTDTCMEIHVWRCMCDVFLMTRVHTHISPSALSFAPPSTHKEAVTGELHTHGGGHGGATRCIWVSVECVSPYSIHVWRYTLDRYRYMYMYTRQIQIHVHGDTHSTDTDRCIEIHVWRDTSMEIHTRITMR